MNQNLSSYLKFNKERKNLLQDYAYALVAA